MKAFLKKIIPANSFLYKINRIRFYYQRRLFSYKLWYPTKWKFDVLDTYAVYKTNVNFIQIGSNDGISNDPLHQYIVGGKWQGILVEPVPHLFEKLKLNYIDLHEKLIFENSALSHNNGSIKFYRLDRKGSSDAPEWFDQLGSFSKEIIERNSWTYPKFKELIIEVFVNGITFKDLLKKYSIADLNLIHIDTEGFDFEVIKMIPFNDFKVDLIMFEHIHLSDSDFKEAIKLLKKNGYKVGLRDKMDTIAIKKELLKNVASR